MSRLSDQTLYEILELEPEASAEEIDRACQRARAIFGPDSLATYSLVTPEEAALLAGRIDEARAVLLDPDARARYDARLGLRPPPAAVAPPAAEGAPEVAAAAGWPAVGVRIGDEPGPARGTAVEPRAAIEVPREVSMDTTEPPPPPIAVLAPIALLAAGAGPGPAGPPPPAPAAEPTAPIRLEVEISPPAAGPIAWTGAMLREAREARGFTVQQIADRTRVTRTHIENVEAERYAALPAAVYLRGIVASMARELRLDAAGVARAYLERMAGASVGGAAR